VKRPHPLAASPWLIVALITILGAGLRLYAIGTVPPGLYRDEAYNGLDALRVLSGERPIFFEANNGREPLFIYLQALSVGLLGRSPVALRLVAAFAGILTIPAIYALGARLYGRRVGMAAAFICATTVWTLNLSRIGFRAVTFPPLVICSLLLLCRGLRVGADGIRARNLSCMIGAGLLYGLAFYTYLAARFSILALLAFAIYTIVRERRRFWLRGWLAFGLASLLVALPLLIYSVQQGEASLARTAQVSIFSPAINKGDPWGTLLRHIWRTLRAFVDRGDSIPRHNVPGRPIFDPLLSLAFWAGLILSFRRARRQPEYALGLIWLGVMVWPTILAEDAPHFLRASGILPMLFYFPALGLGEFWAYLDRHGRERWGATLVGLLLLGSAALSSSAYWRHAQSMSAYYNLEAGATEMAAEINTFLGSGWQGGLRAPRTPVLESRRVYIAPRLWQDWPSVRYLCAQSPALVTAPSSNQAAGASASTDVLLVLWPFEDNSAFLPLLPMGRVIVAHEGAQERGDLEKDSRLLYVTLRSQPTTVVPGNVDALWEQGISLVGYTFAPLGDRQVLATLYWQARSQIAVSYTAFCHVVKDGQPVGQHDGLPAGGYYPTTAWRPGDTIADQHVIALSDDCRSSPCQMLVGLYDWETMTRLQLSDAGGNLSQESAVTLDLSPWLQSTGGR